MILEVYDIFKSFCIQKDFLEDEWNDLLSDDFKYYARNWEMDYEQFAVENQWFSNNQYMNKQEFLSEKRKMYESGLWATEEFNLELVNHKFNEFNIIFTNDNVVIQESNGIKYHTTYRADLCVRINEFGLINYTKAFHKPNTIKTESV